MFSAIRPRSVYDVMAAVGCFAVLATGTAYAANTIGTADIIDGEVKSADIGNNEIGSADVKDGTLNTFDVHSFLGVDVVDGSLTGADIQNESIGAADIGSQQVGPDEVINDSLLQSDIRAGAVTGDEVLDNSLSGTDINEASLNLPQTPTTAAFAFTTAEVPFQLANYTQIVSKSLPAGSWAVVGTVTVKNIPPRQPGINYNLFTGCELRHGSTVIGSTEDSRTTASLSQMTASLTMNGGVQVPQGGGNVGVWCRASDAGPEPPRATAQLMMIRIDGFS